MKDGLVVVVVIVGLIWIWKWPLFDDGVPVYIGICADVVRTADECGRWTSVYAPATFVATAANQEVLGQAPNGAMFKLPSCTVRNKNNWSCEDSPTGTPLHTRTSMIDGEFSRVLLGHSTLGLGELTPDTFPNSPRQTHQLSRWKWLYVRYLRGAMVSRPFYPEEDFYGKPMFKD